jgi:hypothetical protein
MAQIYLVSHVYVANHRTLLMDGMQGNVILLAVELLTIVVKVMN